MGTLQYDDDEHDEIDNQDEDDHDMIMYDNPGAGDYFGFDVTVIMDAYGAEKDEDEDDDDAGDDDADGRDEEE